MQHTSLAIGLLRLIVSVAINETVILAWCTDKSACHRNKFGMYMQCVNAGTCICGLLSGVLKLDSLPLL